MLVDTTTFRILDTVSRYLGKSFSINQLTEEIRKIYGTAYYANIYKRLHDLETRGILNLKRFGKSSVIELNFRNYLLVDFLTEIELKKKIEFLERRIHLQLLLEEMDDYFGDSSSIKSVLSVDPEKNSKLNKMEFLCLLRHLDQESHVQDLTIDIYRRFRTLEDKHNLRIDCLVLDGSVFRALLESDEINPLRGILPRKVAFFCPQAFWSEIREIAEKGIEIRMEEVGFRPDGISEVDLAANLARFGYKEFGSRVGQGRRICIEYIVTSLLVQGDPRRVMAVPVVISKNSVNVNVLVFLSQKFGVSEKLLGILRILADVKLTEEVRSAIELLEALDVKESEIDRSSVLEHMRLYNAA
jgi:hypothetical protein